MASKTLAIREALGEKAVDGRPRAAKRFDLPSMRMRTPGPRMSALTATSIHETWCELTYRLALGPMYGTTISGTALGTASRATASWRAWLLSQALGTTPEFWMKLQAAHDLGRTRPGKPVKLKRVLVNFPGEHGVLKHLVIAKG